ncbi:MAE_28990/MAE_18760 family HEPN-like nuclease [Pseudomonas stutzeri]|nr:MAE_28990/MAE_18760 family HEPN-like nuclease [Stutzerimonas degradans]
MDELLSAFEERLAEVNSYIDFLWMVENGTRNGPPRIEGCSVPISAVQQKILYSGIFLQLYNLVESTMTLCIESVANATYRDGQWLPGDLVDSLRKEWVRSMARTHIDLSSQNRLDYAIRMCQHLVESLPVAEFSIEKGGGGNWDDNAIEEIAERLGFKIRAKQSAYRGIKQPFRDELGPLALVKSLRNKLAHGAISFSESVGGLTVQRLQELTEKLVNYMREVIRCFSEFILSHQYLVPTKRPA